MVPFVLLAFLVPPVHLAREHECADGQQRWLQEARSFAASAKAVFSSPVWTLLAFGYAFWEGAVISGGFFAPRVRGMEAPSPLLQDFCAGSSCTASTRACSVPCHPLQAITMTFAASARDTDVAVGIATVIAGVLGCSSAGALTDKLGASLATRARA